MNKEESIFIKIFEGNFCSQKRDLLESTWMSIVHVSLAALQKEDKCKHAIGHVTSM